MNMGRYLIAVLAVWIVRTVLNALWYGWYTAEAYAAAIEPYVGAFREVVPAYVTADLLFALVFVWLWVKVGAAFGSGAKAGGTYGFVIGLLAGVIPGIYWVYSLTVVTPGMWLQGVIFELVAGVLVGALAAVVYKATSGRVAAPAGA